LSKYSVIIVDEAHQRSLHSDILLGLLKKIQRRRPELRLIITSATLDADALKLFFEQNSSRGQSENDTVHVLPVQGRQHTVEVQYLDTPVNDYIKCAVQTGVLQLYPSRKVHYSEADS